MIHVCFSLYDKSGHYSKFIGTVMLSLFENTNSKVTVHILHDNTLNADNRDKFTRLTKQYNQIVKFYNAEELCAYKVVEIRECLPEIDKNRLSIGALYRFLISHLLPAEIKKVIYLDADIIVNLDLSELWKVELGDKPFGAVPNLFQIADQEVSIERTNKVINLCRAGLVKAEDYFNSGVLLMNLRFMKNADKSLMSGMRFLEEKHLLQYLDQEVLNYCFSTSFLKLPVKFNRYVMLARPENELTVGKMIYHYAGGNVGLGLDMNDPYNRLWWSYFIKTPWFGIDTIDRMFKGATDTMIQPVDLPFDKARVFITDEEHAYQIERNFSVSATEEVIIVDTENEDYLHKLTDLMIDSRGKKVFFIGIPNISSKLLETGFIESKDFFNVSAFYSPIWANYMNNYKLILSI